MKRILSSILTLASLTTVTAIGFDSQLIDGQKFDVSGRFLSGQLDERLVDIHTDKKLSPPVFHQGSHDSNVRALRRYSDCVKNPKTCKSQAAR